VPRTTRAIPASPQADWIALRVSGASTLQAYHVVLGGADERKVGDVLAVVGLRGGAHLGLVGEQLLALPAEQARRVAGVTGKASLRRVDTRFEQPGSAVASDQVAQVFGTYSSAGRRPTQRLRAPGRRGPPPTRRRVGRGFVAGLSAYADSMLTCSS
jgi:hypothetical protein